MSGDGALDPLATDLVEIFRLEGRGEVEACLENGYQIAFFHDQQKSEDTLNNFGFAVEECGGTFERKAYCGISRVPKRDAIGAEKVP
jgi:hypothetical protein